MSEEALEKLNKVMQIVPKIPMLITLKAEAMRFMGKYDEARSLLESNEPSDDPRRRALEARICFDLGYLSACIEAALPVTRKSASSSSPSSLDACVPDRGKLILLVEQAVNAQASEREAEFYSKKNSTKKLWVFTEKR